MEEALKLFDSGDSVQAARAFTRIVKSDEDNSEAWRLLGQCHADNDDDRKAVRCLAAAVQKDPSNLKALASIGVAYFNEGQSDRALQHLRQWVEHHPEYKHLSDESAKTVDEVAEVFKKVVAQGATDPEPRVVLGVLYNLSKEFDDAADVLRQASKLAPDDYTLWNKLGATLANCGNAQEALYAYQHALDLRPKYIRGCLPVQSVVHILVYQVLLCVWKHLIPIAPDLGDILIGYPQTNSAYSTIASENASQISIASLKILSPDYHVSLWRGAGTSILGWLTRTRIARCAPSPPAPPPPRAPHTRARRARAGPQARMHPPSHSECLLHIGPCGWQVH